MRWLVTTKNVALCWGTAGLASLSGLSGAQWWRASHPPPPGVLMTLLGWAPNFFGSIAIIAVALGGALSQNQRRSAQTEARMFALAWCLGVGGLLVWEGLQRGRSAFVFDWGDVGATLVGGAVAVTLFAVFRVRRSA